MFTLTCLMLTMSQPMSQPVSQPVSQPINSKTSQLPNEEDAKLEMLFKQFLQDEFRRHPYFATSQGNREYDDQLDDLSIAARKKDFEEGEQFLKQLMTKIDAGKLSENGKIDFEIWKHSIRYSLWQARHDDRFTFDPRVYGEYLVDSVFSTFSQSTLPRERIVANAAKRIAFIPKVVAAAKDSLTNPPAILTEIAIKRNRAAIVFYEKEIYDLAKETPASSELTKPCQQAVQALKEYQEFLEKNLLSRSAGDWRLGKVRFSEKLALELDAGLSADEVIKLAEDEAVRVEREMYYVSKQLWARLFPGKAVPLDDEAGRRFTTKTVLEKLGDDHGEAGTIVDDARQTVDKIKQFIKQKKILTLPEPDRCIVFEMPEFQRGFSAAYLNPAPTFDPKANSLYAVSPPPSDWPETRKTAYLREYNRAMMQILTIHEAYPGHYVQLEYGNRSKSLIRKVYYSGVFAEGWAVYTEQMMLDQGYGDGDLSLRLHQLKFYLRAVINAILDNHMHCLNMTDEQAMKLLVERGFQTEGEAAGKIQRAKQSSCQLSTYFVGRTAFYNLRTKVQRTRGEQFDLGRYHEEVLSHGTIAVKYLPQLVK